MNGLRVAVVQKAVPNGILLQSSHDLGNNVPIAMTA